MVNLKGTKQNNKTPVADPVEILFKKPKWA